VSATPNGWKDSAKFSELFRDGKLIAQAADWGNRWLWWFPRGKEGEAKTREEAKEAVEKAVGK
jgi:hypothetical protein